MGNVGIGTWTADGGNLIVNGGGNVGIGSAWPGKALDIVGALRASTNISQGVAVSSGTHSIALGDTASTGTITSSGNGTFAGGYSFRIANTAALVASGAGTIAYGEVISVGGSASISSTSGGSVALGYAQDGTILSAGAGSFVVGAATSGTLQATGTASVAMGENVQANAYKAFAFGGSVINNNASTFMVGFNAAPTLTVTSANVGIGTNPQITLGIDGQMVTFIGTSNTDAVQFTSGTGVKLAGAVSFTVGIGDTITFMYDATNSLWTEIARSNN